MALDASIITQAQAPAFNPLQTVSQLQALQNAQNQNKLFQARQAAGQDYQGAIGPDGQVNQNAFLQALAGDRAAAPMAQEAGGNSLVQRGQQISNTAANLGVTQSYAANLRKVAGTVPALGNGQPDLPSTLAAIKAGADAGLYPADFAASIAGDGAKLATFAKAAAISGDAGANAEGAMFGNPTQISTGGAIKSERVNSVIGDVTPMTGAGANIPVTMTPGEKASRVPFVGADGSLHSAPVADLATPTGAPTPAGHNLQTGLAPGVAEGAAQAAAGAAAQLTAARQDAASSSQRLNALRTALHGLQSSNTGPGTNETNNIASFLQSQVPFGLAKILPGVDPTKIKNYDEANKYLTQYAAGTAAQYGPGTDAKLATAANGNASTHISNLAAQDVVKVNIGLERMKQAQLQAFDQSGQPPQNFGAFSSNWNRTTDPRAFMLDQMPAKDRAAMLSSMKPAELQAFRNSVRTAIGTGVLSASDFPK